jgi:hypothetical protein
MSSERKVVIGLGSIWGLFAFGVMVVTSFTIGANDSAPEVIAIVLYGFTVLPSCLLAIRFPKACGLWLVMVSLVTCFGFAYQDFSSKRPPDESLAAFLRGLIVSQAVALIPAVIGGCLLFLERETWKMRRKAA